MPVGNPADMGGLNVKLGSCAVSLRDAARQAQNLWGFVASLGADQAAQTAALVTLGFTSGDAATFWTKANNAYAVSQLYYGQITQPSAFNYDSALAGARGAS
jgi:hypothetical protein